MKKIFLFLIFISLKVNAFTFNNNIEASFENPRVVVNVNDASCNNNGLDPESIYNMAYDAVTDYWNRVPNTSLNLVMGTITEDATPSYYDLKIDDPQAKVDKYILISCNENTDNFDSPNIIGLTLPNNISGGHIRGSLFLLNDTGNSSTNVINKLSRNEITAVIAHEIGHAIGLGHSPTDAALMYFSLIPNRRSVGVDDMEGVAYLYPKEQPFGIISCATIDTDGGPPGPNFFLPFILGFIIISIFIKRFKKV